MQHIITATDGSACAGRAIDIAATLAKAAGATLLIVTVQGNRSGEGVQALARAEGSAAEALEILANQTLREASERAARLGAPSIQSRLCWGDPAEVIVATAGHEHTDAIVVGRRGRGRLAGLLLGSVSQKLVALAPCTVVVVP
jgi:nucleotide-binding universal stress UspA family protein